MYILGFFVYAFVVFSYYQFTTIQSIVDEGIRLAPVIVYSMLVLGAYPLGVFLFHVLLRKKSISARNYLESQTKIASTVAVSLGLIGTFQGLTQMVESIAASMNSGGDMTEKMAAMLSSISGALSAMSYAFLTSIVGVGVSVIILTAVNFLALYYSNGSDKKTSEKSLLNKVDINLSKTIGNEVVNDSLKELVRLTELSYFKQKDVCDDIQRVINESSSLILAELRESSISTSLVAVEGQIKETNKLLRRIAESIEEPRISTLSADIENMKCEVVSKLDTIKLDSNSIKERVESLPFLVILNKQIMQALDKIMSIFSFGNKQ